MANAEQHQHDQDKQDETKPLIEVKVDESSNPYASASVALALPQQREEKEAKEKSFKLEYLLSHHKDAFVLAGSFLSPIDRASLMRAKRIFYNTLFDQQCKANFTFNFVRLSRLLSASTVFDHEMHDAANTLRNFNPGITTSSVLFGVVTVVDFAALLGFSISGVSEDATLATAYILLAMLVIVMFRFCCVASENNCRPFALPRDELLLTRDEFLSKLTLEKQLILQGAIDVLGKGIKKFGNRHCIQIDCFGIRVFNGNCCGITEKAAVFDLIAIQEAMLTLEIPRITELAIEKGSVKRIDFTKTFFQAAIESLRQNAEIGRYYAEVIALFETSIKELDAKIEELRKTSAQQSSGSALSSVSSAPPDSFSTSASEHKMAGLAANSLGGFLAGSHFAPAHSSTEQVSIYQSASQAASSLASFFASGDSSSAIKEPLGAGASNFSLPAVSMSSYAATS